jgi:dihydrodipicolinate synthase/N-acetylneuraminate lyase
LFRYGAMVAVYKEAMRQRGFDPGYVRGPQRELTTTEKRELAEGMKEAGLI